jgi:hypothetical protein
METTMTAVIVTAQGYGITGRTKTCACASMKGEGVTQRTMAYDFASRRGRPRRLRPKIRGVRPAISMSEMADRSATSIYASLVKGESDDSFTLIWSRRIGD